MEITQKEKEKRGFSSLKSHSNILKFLKKEDTNFLNLFITHLKEKHNLTAEQIIELIIKKQEILIPITIFDNKLSPLEAITKFLKENENLSYHKIALLLNRNDRTIWTTYQRTLKKYPKKLIPKETTYQIPISVFLSKLTIFESLVKFLKESFSLSYHKIALLLNRNDRTIWTVYSRSKLK